MATVCEVCYSSAEGDYLDIYHEEHTEKNIAHKLSTHLQRVTLEGIENPRICIACWTTLESFHELYNLVEDLHSSQPESSSSSDDDAEGLQRESIITYVTDSTYREVTYHKAEPSNEDVEADEAAIADISETNRMITFDLTEEDGSDREQLDEGEDTEVEHDDGDDDGRHPKNCNKDSDLTKFYGTMICQLCKLDRIAQGAPSESYDTFDELKQHMLEVHHVGNTCLQCPLCSKRYYSRWELLQHMDMHKNPEKFRCPTCGEIYLDLKAHVNFKHAELQFECKDCKRKYPSASRLATHAKVAHAPKDVVCKECNKAFSKYFIKTHMRNIHGKAVYFCELCGKAYSTIGLLNKHQTQHQSVATVACPVCKQRVRANYIKGHMKLMHTKSTPIKCPSCDKSFLHKRSMIVHQKRTCPVNGYRCETCKKSFQTVAKLTEHQQTHKERVCTYYMCTVCMKKFDSKSLLYVHQQEMHKTK